MAADSKTEKATPKKRRDERKEGNIFFSADIVSVAGVFGTFYSMKLLFPGIYDTVSRFMEKFLTLGGGTTAASKDTLAAIFPEFISALIKAGLPIMLISVSLAIVATGAQTKFLFTAKKFRPKLRNISPIQGIKKLFSLRNVVELIKNIIKVILLSVILYTALKGDFTEVVRTMDMDIKVSAAFMLGLALDMVLKVVLIFAVIAAFDYMYQWWEYERQIKMSKQEVKEELKQTEGNPEIKGKIRDIQKQRARMRMMQAVPGADVIIRNPTHFAVALKYDMEKMAAPVVLAKGQDELALRIVRVGEENQVTVIENKQLARGLYAAAEVGQEIPREYYGAVAEILVYVYRLKDKTE
ncbi:flagellar biosynthesis protein FlhB [Mediterraneibacter sp. NSJ-55]|uniref:Flagellar biosynthetic protein FlhB n=1 Tax=Mediterraneibacter hominis TaxID=2763054 RepID=A0A923LID5_9FIRM|nr:flagellar biosynthesis protein FlhB [Mediterraneibacter hominis]MBC5689353.1 flagellar biosynthesis protein FlhB [Mediterraneibacter hominis]